MRIDRFLAPPAAPPVTPTHHAVWALAFRPFFLGAALLVALWLPLWVAIVAGVTAPPLALPAVDWHIHELVFGFAGAVLAGFLLTAARNWTQRPTASGTHLKVIFGVWLLGRVVLVVGQGLPPLAVAALSLAYLPLVIAALTRPIVLTKNQRNYAFPLLLLVFFGVGVLFHLGPDGFRRAFSTAAVGLVAVFLVVMGGRVIPFFTRNALPDARVRTPPPLAWAASLSTLALPVLFLVSAPTTVIDVAALVAGGLNLARGALWNPLATLRRPILLVLHVGHAWVGVGLVLMGLGGFVAGLDGSAPMHALTVGGLGTLAIGMMARVSLGHTGRPLVVGRPMVVAFAFVTAAALIRVALPLIAPAATTLAITVSGLAFAAAWLMFAIVHWPILTRPRFDGALG